jgi:hypothetical protein
MLLNAIGLIALLLLPGEDEALEPVSFRHVLKEYRDLVSFGETPLQGLYGPEDSTGVVLGGEFTPVGQAYVVLLSSETPGLAGFAAFRGARGVPCRADFQVIGEYGWWLWECEGMRADDLNGDGFTDLEVEASYMTGIGPEGAVPFSMNSVLLWVPGEQTFVFDEELSF